MNKTIAIFLSILAIAFLMFCSGYAAYLFTIWSGNIVPFLELQECETDNERLEQLLEAKSNCSVCGETGELDSSEIPSQCGGAVDLDKQTASKAKQGLEAKIEANKAMSVEDIKAYIRETAKRYGVDVEIINKIVFCESSFNIEAIGSQGEIGLAQFKKSTFVELAKKANFDYFMDDIYNPKKQIELLVWAIKNGYGNYWTCFRKIAVDCSSVKCEPWLLMTKDCKCVERIEN